MNSMINKIIAIQGNHPSTLNPKSDTSIFLANEIQKKNIDNLLEKNTFTITTGHQLNLLTGPLYFIYKIL